MSDRHDVEVRTWSEAERSWFSLVGLIAGTSFGEVLLLIFASMSDASVLVGAAMLWFDVCALCWFGSKADWCRQWREYHAALAANPVAWPWPRMPGDVA